MYKSVLNTFNQWLLLFLVCFMALVTIVNTARLNALEEKQASAQQAKECNNLDTMEVENK